jgi:hypothetical protein
VTWSSASQSALEVRCPENTNGGAPAGLVDPRRSFSTSASCRRASVTRSRVSSWSSFTGLNGISIVHRFVPSGIGLSRPASIGEARRPARARRSASATSASPMARTRADRRASKWPKLAGISDWEIALRVGSPSVRNCSQRVDVVTTRNDVSGRERNKRTTLDSSPRRVLEIYNLIVASHPPQRVAALGTQVTGQRPHVTTSKIRRPLPRAPERCPARFFSPLFGATWVPRRCPFEASSVRFSPLRTMHSRRQKCVSSRGSYEGFVRISGGGPNGIW